MLAHFNINTPITLTYKAYAFDIGAVALHNRQYLEVRYSSKATWYLHACCKLNTLRWRWHHVFNIWMAAHYVRAHIRQIIWCVHPWTLHSFWMKFLIKPIILIVYTRWTYEYCFCMLQLNLESIVLLKSCHLCAVPHALLFGLMWRMDLV